MPPPLEHRFLQLAVALAALVPISAGLMGALHGLGELTPARDSHARYLSGLLLGIGLAFWACIPTLERRGEAVRALGALVVIGGLARLAAIPITGLDAKVLFPLSMELGVTPMLLLWRERLGRRVGESLRAAADDR